MTLVRFARELQRTCLASAARFGILSRRLRGENVGELPDWDAMRWAPKAPWTGAGPRSGETVKCGSQRTVVRVDVDGVSLHVKIHHVPDRATLVRQCLRPNKAYREYCLLAELRRRGLPAPEPVAWAESGTFGLGESALVTKTLVGAESLVSRWADVSSPAARQRLAKRLGELLAAMHDVGLAHGDLHPGNFLTRPETGELFLVDLDAAGLTAPLDRETAIRNLAPLAAFFRQFAFRADRLRFARAYLAARGWDASPGARADFARRLEAESWRASLALWAARDLRCLRNNRYYRCVSGPGVVGHVAREVDAGWLSRFLADPDALFAAPTTRLLKDGRSSTVAEVATPMGPAILKRFAVTRASDPWAALVRPTPALRSWILGQSFVERGLPTARPLVVLQRRRAGLVREAYLLTERIADAVDLREYLVSLDALPEADGREATRRHVARVGRAIRELHLRLLSHRDLKASNLLVPTRATEATPRRMATISAMPLPPRSGEVWFIDLVGVVRERRLSKRRRVRDLARVAASFVSEARLTRADRLRFLRAYLAWDLHGKATWKPLWRRIAEAVNAKIAANRASGRPLA